MSYVVADDLGRNNGDLPWEINRAIFVGAKPKSDQPTTMVVALESGEQAVVNLLSVTEGELAKADKRNWVLLELTLPSYWLKVTLMLF